MRYDVEDLARDAMRVPIKQFDDSVKHISEVINQLDAYLNAIEPDVTNNKEEEENVNEV